MKDPELVRLERGFIIGVFAAIVFAVPLIIFLMKGSLRTNIYNDIENKKTFVLLIEKNECDECYYAKKILGDYNVNYKILNKDRNKDYKKIIKKIGVNNDRDYFPIIVDINDGVMKANLFYVDQNSLVQFIENHKLYN